MTCRLIPALADISSGLGYTEKKEFGEEVTGEGLTADPPVSADAAEEGNAAGAGIPPRRW
jgi:hypothetical protein